MMIVRPLATLVGWWGRFTLVLILGATGGRTRAFFLHELDRQGPGGAFDHVPIHAVLGHLGVADQLKLQEGHATGPIVELVAQQVHIHDVAVGGEEFSYLLLIHVRGQVPHVQAGAGAFIFRRSGEGHFQSLAASLVAIHAIHGSSRLAFRHVVDESVATAYASPAVADDLGLADLTELGEETVQLRLRHVLRKVVEDQVRLHPQIRERRGRIHWSSSLEHAAYPGVSPTQRRDG